jgi:hypothetical protein
LPLGVDAGYGHPALVLAGELARRVGEPAIQALLACASAYSFTRTGVRVTVSPCSFLARRDTRLG